MKIDYVIVSSDTNEMYLDFWEVIKPMWNNLVGIKPVLVLICDEESYVDDGDSIIIKIKQIDNINIPLQAQLGRIYGLKYFENKNILISDIDMIPLNKEYFTELIKDINDESIIIYSSDAYQGCERYPMCYISANSEIYKDIFELNNLNYEEFIDNMVDFNWGWDTDEKYITKQINDSKYNLVKLNRGWSRGIAENRVDRVKWEYNVLDLIKGKYIDSHSLRPYKNYKNEIDLICNAAQGKI